MYTTNMVEFNTQQTELHRRAEYHRLVKSLEKPNPVIRRTVNTLGKLMIQSGQHLINRVQTAH
jgi:hypothetical protein